MAARTKRTDPKLWEAVKAEVTAGAKGGEPGEWSARKAQMAVALYKARGGDYCGEKAADNSLVQWTQEEWGTKSGKPSGETHERYLPKAALKALSPQEYARTTAAKRRAAKKGVQFSAQPADVAHKVAAARKASHLEDKPVAELRVEAAKRGIEGRSLMKKDELVAALTG